MMSHISWRGEQNTLYKGVETLSSIRVLKHWGEAQKEQYLLAVDLDRYKLTWTVIQIFEN